MQGICPSCTAIAPFATAENIDCLSQTFWLQQEQVFVFSFVEKYRPRPSANRKDLSPRYSEPNSKQAPSDPAAALIQMIIFQADAFTESHVDYELVSIVDHSGSVNFGHYTARVKNMDRQSWCVVSSLPGEHSIQMCVSVVRYMMNDEVVHPIGQPIGPSESAYILALRRVETS